MIDLRRDKLARRISPGRVMVTQEISRFRLEQRFDLDHRPIP
jgi:hypothetical protein